MDHYDTNSIKHLFLDNDDLHEFHYFKLCNNHLNLLS